ncbi:hypothetical protein COO60DRAFT_1636449 [Scenedesmus sp. NREL 46B-D3]|nr:hypothetical protein COO60DRAFT_1636449 [Scenedesmus sp. NREL 46B-D3]
MFKKISPVVLFPLPPLSAADCRLVRRRRCFEVSCVPRFVESADGSVFLDRRDACRDTTRGAIIQIVDECRCSNADRQLSERGNFNWCCNVETPRLGVDRHIDLSKQVFTELIRDGDFGLGIMGLRWRPASCSYIGPVRINGPSAIPAGTAIHFEDPTSNHTSPKAPCSCKAAGKQAIIRPSRACRGTPATHPTPINTQARPHSSSQASCDSSTPAPACCEATCSRSGAPTQQRQRQWQRLL